MPQLSAQGSGLELGEHPRFERRWRIIQTIIFSFFGLLAVAGLLGLLGSGPLANAKAGATPGSPYTLEYPRFLRARATSQILITPHATGGGHLALHLDGSLTEVIQVQQASPAPIAAAPDAGGTLFLFALEPGATGSIALQVKPQKPGLVKGTISLDGRGQPVTLIVWP